MVVVCNCWLQEPRWSRAWRASIHAACSALHAEQQSSSSVQTTVALAASHIETVPARRSRAVDTGRGVLGPGSGGAHTTSNHGLYMHSQQQLVVRQEFNFPPTAHRRLLLLQAIPVHEPQPAWDVSKTIELLIQHAAACRMLNQESDKPETTLRRPQRVQRDHRLYALWCGRSRI